MVETRGGGGGRNVIIRDVETLSAQKADPNRCVREAEEKERASGGPVPSCFSDSNSFPVKNVFT